MNFFKSIFSLFSGTKKRKQKNNRLKTNRRKNKTFKRKNMRGGWGESFVNQPLQNTSVMKGGWGETITPQIQ